MRSSWWSSVWPRPPVGSPTQLVIVVARAEAETERQAAARERIERRGLLGEDERVGPQRRDQNRCHEPNAARGPGHGSERDERLEVRVDEPVDDADAAEAHLFGPSRPVEDAAAARARDRGGQTDADPHVE